SSSRLSRSSSLRPISRENQRNPSRARAWVITILGWFVQRWTIEVTFQEARAHLGVETQRQWSDTAIARTTPFLLALFSIVTLLAARLSARQRRRVAAAAWYPKPRPTFADALAAVRCAILRERTLATSPRRRARTKPRFRLSAPWAYALCHAA
ncbi:hypothetical protein ABID82_006739, partial [Methylobacterium sp. PvP062]